MKNQFRLVALLTIVFATSQAFAADNSCREIIVDAYKSLGEPLKAEGFSNSSFEELGISVEEFNELDSVTQEAIYLQVKPLSVMVEETINKLNRYIKRYVGTMYEFYLTDELEQWRSLRDALRVCTE